MQIYRGCHLPQLNLTWHSMLKFHLSSLPRFVPLRTSFSTYRVTMLACGSFSFSSLFLLLEYLSLDGVGLVLKTGGGMTNSEWMVAHQLISLSSFKGFWECLHVLIPASLPLQSIWRGGGLCIGLCVQMDVSSHPSNHCHFPSPFSPAFYLIYWSKSWLSILFQQIFYFIN